MILERLGYTANVIAHHGILETGVPFLNKPFSKHDLAVKVREVLDRGKVFRTCRMHPRQH